ncbi:hypothetical protein ACFFQF_16620 [Haladaptatus pallidirubidus]|uniref:hypothetical protein n=1 Tax=Haladaptatus pallidirubidus TaxID=1008152 RepID=UPI0035EB502C
MKRESNDNKNRINRRNYLKGIAASGAAITGLGGVVTTSHAQNGDSSGERLRVTCEQVTLFTRVISGNNDPIPTGATVLVTVEFEDGSEQEEEATVDENGVVQVSLPGNRTPTSVTLFYEAGDDVRISQFDEVEVEDAPCEERYPCPDIDVKYKFKDGTWVAVSGEPDGLSVDGDETHVTICADFPFVVDYELETEETTVEAEKDEETDQYCVTIGDGCTEICWFRVYCPESPNGECLECPDVGQAQYNLIKQSDSECSFERVTGSEEWDDIITNITKEPDNACGFQTGPQSICLETEYCLQGRVESFIPRSGSGTGEMTAELGPVSPDENDEICFTVSSPQEYIYSFTVKCGSDDTPSCPPCTDVFPNAVFIEGEWVVEQSAQYITVEGDQEQVTICAGEDLDCSLELSVRSTMTGPGGCLGSFNLLCGECITLSADDLGAPIQRITVGGPGCPAG